MPRVYDTEHILLYRRVWNLQSGNGFYIMVVCNQRKMKEQSLQKDVLKRVTCGCRVACSKGGGGDRTNPDYIVQRCALFVLAKHVETVTARMIETQ